MRADALLYSQQLNAVVYEVRGNENTRDWGGLGEQGKRDASLCQISNVQSVK